MTDLQVPQKKFRPEIEGIRAVAAFLVAIYHIWLGSVSGGVDVFFIVSGYLITTSLLTRVEKQGTINMTEYVMGLARRLFPLAFTVILVIALLSILMLPQAQWQETIAQTFSSAFYYQNWQLATSAVDYLAQNNQAGPFQHFWALSIQGQFYVTWPLLILLVFFLARKVLKTPVRKTLLVVLGVIFTASLSYSIYITNVNQPWAYFDTFARVWEFSMGGMLALLISYVTLPKAISTVIGWLGLAIISLTGIMLPVANVFPGYVALLPTTGVILVIIAAENGSRFGVERLLGSKPFLYFGGISYAYYLWHWPLLIFYYAYFDADVVTAQGGILILVLAFILSVASTKILESPIRGISVRTSKGKLAAVLACFMAPVIATGITWGAYVEESQGEVQEDYDVEDYPGARVISDGITPSEDKDPIPTSVQAKDHLPEFYEETECYSGLNNAEVKKCSYGDTENPEYTIALVGGSHSGHWFPALQEMSDELSLQIDVYNKDGCRFSDNDFDGQLNESCMQWNEDVVEPLIQDEPDLVFTTANVNRGETVPQGYINQWKKLEGVTEIFAVRDNPRMAEDIPLCVEEKGPEQCAIPRDEALADVAPWENTEGIPDNVTFADLSEYFCDEDSCDPVIGNVLVYRDKHHLTTLYSLTLSPALKKHIVNALEKIETNE
ncbi:Peptidoglycan/LPS O-acetylase OafA/YrhL, contains acyltransferase and SGNH-hydrolase domains [Alteribacillus persepolensis]|uniref:Peptidoglycan/LPS O-acetylase OafA/YrhL, contains acyltransferase and SGNH-hydrolase domains n=1 Tax=Alteribacillus persepolensis TaxID=568899 RepID=A0A1G8JZX8_9BACI|nr:acyltransferase family protein [Alteribacillus persepolensis]SDI36735.1 Peptidoglycan/LPS O-acetylase OafA/YrhL, contains acyltransferase and SGNH-hydrolase domains [Alteribacillus persepolensis]